MKFIAALDLEYENTGKMVSLVGGGGKTSSIFTLAKELAGIGKKVLITTTTSMYNPEDFGIPNISVLGDHVTDEGKLKGISKKRADDIFAQNQYDVILIEADGSKGKPVKAPAEYEPVIPASTGVVIGVIGIDCFGKRITADYVHRPDIFASLTGVDYGGVIEERCILSLVSLPEGLFKDCPESAKKVLLFNKVLDGASKEIAERIGYKILEKCNDIDRVLIGAVQEGEPIKALIKR